MFGNGISGCRLWLTDERTVRKQSADDNYNDRLVRQATKQRMFARTNLAGVRTPSVKEIGEGGGLTHFDMDFVVGQTPYELFTHCDKQTVDNVQERILNYLRHTNNTCRVCESDEFRNKTLKKLQDTLGKTAHEKFAEYLIQKTADTGFVLNKSFCHGDLTLSNMIYMKGDLYLIDFLDSFIDSPLIDLAKLKQDLFYDWTLDCHIDCTQSQRLRIKQICRRIWRAVENEMSQSILTEEFRIVEALNFLRIEPYTKNEKMRLKLDETIKKLPIYEEFNSTDGRKVDQVPEHTA